MSGNKRQSEDLGENQDDVQPSKKRKFNLNVELIDENGKK